MFTNSQSILMLSVNSKEIHIPPNAALRIAKFDNLAPSYFASIHTAFLSFGGSDYVSANPSLLGLSLFYDGMIIQHPYGYKAPFSILLTINRHHYAKHETTDEAKYVMTNYCEDAIKCKK